MRGALAVLGQMAVAVIIAVTVTAVSLVAIARVEWPAYNSSNQLHALTTVGQFVCLAGLFACGMVWRRGRRVLARLGTLLFLSAFSVVTLAMPLGATKLYLFGISVDQQFRTEYLTRLADSPALHDMTYQGLPPFYPPGWFWIGGRMAALSGTPAWEMFKPWAIISITVAIALAFVLWAAMIRFEYALVVTTATAAATLAYSPAEPYAAVITVLLPPVFVLAWSGLRGGSRNGGWAAVIATGVFLGVAALFYSLLLGYAAFTLAIMMALVLAVGAPRAVEPLLRLLVIAVISAAMWLIGLGPWLLAAVKGTPAGPAPLSTICRRRARSWSSRCCASPCSVRCACSARCGWCGGPARRPARVRWPSPCSPSTRGRCCRCSPRWLGTTLLSFRLQPPLTVLLAAAGAFGFIEVTLAIARAV